MDEEINFGLDLSQWETLKALDAPNPDYRRVNELALRELMALELAAMPECTACGQTVLSSAGQNVNAEAA